ncbi:MAG: PH domain-containing protein, partial [Caldilinea sp.]
LVGLPEGGGLPKGGGLSQWAGPLTLSGVLLSLAALAYAAWLVADWRNDTYEVSNDEIAHVDRVPLGFSEERKSANLGRIQNVSMSIPSPWHWFFNYGDVTCQTAAELGDFIFRGVPDPRSVAREILTRMERYRRRTEREAATKRAQELPDWFEMYNRIEPDVLEKRALQGE